MKFLVSTDNHCGYSEVKKLNYDDAFVTLDEVFEQSKSNDVDFVLLGGDLFHDNNPSRETRIRVIRTFRKYVLNGPETKLEFVSQPENSFNHSAFKFANFEDANLCVSTPVFSIHGNHDDLSGTSTSALDVLHEAGLLNLFGRFTEVTRFVVDPILLRKEDEFGNIKKLAIYGISSQRDDRLARALDNDQVIFRRPTDAETWSSILILHQNRPLRSTVRTTGSYINVQKLPTFFNLIIWGHEHESIVEPEVIQSINDPTESYLILQPGSSVATSLTLDEAKQKHSFIIDFPENNSRPEITPLPLQTPRQIYWDCIDLKTCGRAPECVNVRLPTGMLDEELFNEKVEAMIELAQQNRNSRQPVLPLIRVKMIYSGDWKKVPPMSARKVGAKFVGRVLNAIDILSTARERSNNDNNRSNLEPLEPRDIRTGEKAAVIIQKMVSDYFESATGSSRLRVLRNDAMFAAISDYNNSTAKNTVLDSQLKECIRSQLETFEEKLVELTQNIELESTESGYKDFEEHLEEIVQSDNFSQSQIQPISQFSEFQFLSQAQTINGSTNSNDVQMLDESN